MFEISELKRFASQKECAAGTRKSRENFLDAQQEKKDATARKNAEQDGMQSRVPAERRRITNLKGQILQ